MLLVKNLQVVNLISITIGTRAVNVLIVFVFTFLSLGVQGQTTEERVDSFFEEEESLQPIA